MARTGPEPDFDIAWRAGRPRLLLRRTWVCRTCGSKYRPEVKAGSRVLLFIGIMVLIVLVVALGVAALERLDERATRRLGFGLLPILLLLSLFAPAIVRRLGLGQRQPPPTRPVYDAASGRKPRRGEIVLECPQCGAREARPSRGA